MFVTRLSMRGLTQICGSFSIHASLLLVMLIFMPTGDFRSKESGGGPIPRPDDTQLYVIMITTHVSLMLSTFLVSMNLLEGVIQQSLCYASALLYIFMISMVTKEIYVQPGFMVLLYNWDMLIRWMFL